jgi:hypothetical protein
MLQLPICILSAAVDDEAAKAFVTLPMIVLQVQH